MSFDLGTIVRGAASALRACGQPDTSDLAARLDSLPTIARFDRTRESPLAASFLADALTTPGHHALADHIPADPAALPWTEGTLPMPASFRGRYMFTKLAGPDAPLRADGFYFGLYLQSPETFYPSHWHRAEEHYYVLSGSHDWQKGDGPFVRHPAGTLIHHRPDEPHAMRTGAGPLLAMWTWTGDLDAGSYRMVG